MCVCMQSEGVCVCVCMCAHIHVCVCACARAYIRKQNRQQLRALCFLTPAIPVAHI